MMHGLANFKFKTALANRHAALRLDLPLLPLFGSILPPKLSPQYSWK
jgi:hypothetical protein